MKYKSVYQDKVYTLTGKVSKVILSEKKVSFVLKDKENIQMFYYDDFDLNDGDKVTVNVLLSTPKKNTIPNTFNYQKYLYNNGIYKVGTVNKIEVNKKNKPDNYDSVAISYAKQVDINMFFQIKDEKLGYGVGRKIDGNDYFVDGVGSDEIKFSFNSNNYGENGDPFELGYGKNNNGENPISVSYLSKHESHNDNTWSDTPESYDYFSAGGYTSGETPNTIRFDDYDGLIDEIYIDTDGDEHFDFEDCVTLTKLRGTDWE